MCNLRYAATSSTFFKATDKSDLKNFFNSQKIEDQNSQEDLNTACAALLCEAASMDGSYDEKEKEVILSLIKKQLLFVVRKQPNLT